MIVSFIVVNQGCGQRLYNEAKTLGLVQLNAKSRFRLRQHGTLSLLPSVFSPCGAKKH
jgi:hypothetical protein